ncbi:MAG: alpha-hydroxy acid oxidase [Gemmatimonadota bacterium]
MDLINLYDFEAAARGALSPMAFGYYVGGAHDEITLRENHSAYDRITLRYRVLRDVSSRSTAATVLGRAVSMPILVAPTGFQGLAHEDAEVGTARAAGAAGTVMILSTLSTTPMEDVAAAGGDVWFQLYVYKERELTAQLVRRAEAAGCGAIVLTVDAPLLGGRERDLRNRFQLPEGIVVSNVLPAGKERLPESMSGSRLAAYVEEMFDASLDWDDLAWLCELTDLPVLVKGIVHPDDARMASEHGAAGVIVSNHGGRQLDTSPPTIEALPRVLEAVASAWPGGPAGSVERGCAVLVDGGIRRGTDVVKAIAMGADAVCVGRPVLWGLAVDGEAGVSRVLEILRNELDLAMGLCGASSVDELRAMGPELLS